MKKSIFLNNIIAAIDVGTTKICTCIAHVIDDNNFEIIGVSSVPSYGLERGMVVDMNQAIHAIKSSLQEAELLAGCTVERVAVGISGAHIQSHSSMGVIPLTKGCVRQQDIDQVLASSKAINLPQGQHILHVLPHYFILDGEQKIQDPLGLHGVRLEVKSHIVSGALALVNNLIKCCQSAGVDVSDIVLEQLASAHAVLTTDERQLGVALLDIGGGTSDFAVYSKGNVAYTHVIPLAGTNFTKDVAIGLQMSLKKAEEIKLNHGQLFMPVAHETLAIADKVISVHELTCILEARAVELLEMVHHHLVLANNVTTINSLVLTGGGSLLKDLDSLAHYYFDIPVRLGLIQHLAPHNSALLHPSYATAYGLLLHALKQKGRVQPFEGVSVIRLMQRMRSWLTDIF